MLAIPWFISLTLPESWLRLFIVFSTSLIASACVIYFYGLPQSVRVIINHKLRSLKGL